MAAVGSTSKERQTKSRGLSGLPKRRNTHMTVCTFNPRMLASDASINNLMLQAQRIKYDIIGLTDTRRPQPHHVVFNTGEELFLGTCNRRGIGGIGVLVNTNVAMSINSFKSLTNRIGRLRLNRCGSLPAVSVFVVYAPTPNDTKEEMEKFYMDLETFYKEDHAFYKIIVGDFNAKIGPRRSAEELHIGTHGLEWDEQGERLSEFIMSTKTIHGNSQFQKPEFKRWTWESPCGRFHDEIDHVIFNRRFCLTDVAVIPKFQTGSDHRLLRAKFYFSEHEERSAKFKQITPKTTTNWELSGTPAVVSEDAVTDNIDEECGRPVQHLRGCSRNVRSARNKRLSSETLELIRQRGIARSSGNFKLTSELAKRCREAIKKDLRERRAAALANAEEAGKSICSARPPVQQDQDDCPPTS
ncbi:craniofacial development protein 2-like [Sorex fumeus]|uniref:craniofacial development protein 2-like n=1 Tax=Sorex fumeus TaxID=62283 RepID=UPI0024AD3571|nr:craniofacial development protein 2-like [Sorex fumeus]XP_055965818.1 craniofacial development protein 2-like [Sorex fumeus]XP_055965819.1 craniofacial development protein 2-like [Sorex fumeus]XP_055965820.1 craniofacial development protein 2-like [Sorex fumeus]XP_055965822.1 craniofacial development protein 2-like [Sorex fumeus]XP_055965823.1 craniofacial development protein 2-like [Sorex fumeus]XP_055965824.1 craniofacial development protein 2-like [Sorex fumeus]XP_055965825.1 craniofaci